MSNPSVDNVAISLHVYSPPYSLCNIYSLEKPFKQEVSMISLYSNLPYEEKKVDQLTSCPKKVHASLESFIGGLKETLKRPTPDPDAMEELLSTIQFSCA